MKSALFVFCFNNEMQSFPSFALEDADIGCLKAARWISLKEKTDQMLWVKGGFYQGGALYQDHRLYVKDILWRHQLISVVASSAKGGVDRS